MDHLDRRKQTGKQGEDAAARFLESRGYVILKRNYRTRRGEIDIVARDGGAIVFVEVKARRSGRYGNAKYAITPAKQKKTTLAAYSYLKSLGGAPVKARFDVVTVFISQGQPYFELIRNAFEPAG